MKDAPGFDTVAALLRDPARATILAALVGGEARTAAELAAGTGIARQTASSHLATLLEAGLLRVLSQGRHRYFQLAAPDVAAMLETIVDAAHRTRGVAKPAGPRDPALRRSRRCYGHLAGELAVEAYDSFVERRFVALTRQEEANHTVALTAAGRAFFAGLGIDLDPLDSSRRPLCRPCLDWSVRRHHLAGSLGAALLDLCYRKGWANAAKDSRVVRFGAPGEAAFRRTLLAGTTWTSATTSA